MPNRDNPASAYPRPAGRTGPTRRAALAKLGGAAAAGAAAAAVGGALAPQAADADTGTMEYGVGNNAGDSSTGLLSSNPSFVFQGLNTVTSVPSGQHADGLRGFSSAGAGVEGINGDSSAPDTPLQPGVLGRSTGQPGVMGLSTNSVGVFGTSLNATAMQAAAGRFTAMYGLSIGPSGGSGYAGVVGDSNGNAGVAGFTSAASRAAGEFTHTAGGRGGLFTGGKAQVRLVPGTAGTHPSGGSAGDLYVDSAHRLWFCKGSGKWVQLA